MTCTCRRFAYQPLHGASGAHSAWHRVSRLLIPPEPLEKLAILEILQPRFLDFEDAIPVPVAILLLSTLRSLVRLEGLALAIHVTDWRTPRMLTSVVRLLTTRTTPLRLLRLSLDGGTDARGRDDLPFTIAVLRVIAPLAPVLVGLTVSICSKYNYDTTTCSDGIAADDTHEVVAIIRSLQRLSHLVIIATLPPPVVTTIASLPSLASLCIGHVPDVDFHTSQARRATTSIRTARGAKQARFSRSIEVDTFGTECLDIKHSNLRSLTMFDIGPPLLRSIFKLSCYSIIHLELTSNGNQAKLVDLWWLDSICLLRALHSLTIVNADIGDLQLQSLLRSKAPSTSPSSSFVVR